jgi:hypothetical protein
MKNDLKFPEKTSQNKTKNIELPCDLVILFMVIPYQKELKSVC